MRKKRIVLRALLVSAIFCLLLGLLAATKPGWVPEAYRWLADPVTNIASHLACLLIILWMAIRRMPGDKLLLDREEAAGLQRVLTCIPWWFVFSVMAIIGVAIWIGTWSSWWAAQQYPIQ